MKKPLIMICPERLILEPPVYPLPEGYEVADYQESDSPEYIELLKAEGWNLNADAFQTFLHKVLPGGLFLIKNKTTGEIAATAAALHNPESTHYTFPFGGDIGFVRTHPDHRNKGLGLFVTALAAERLIKADYQSIRIVTNDERLPALKTYIKLGFVPFLYELDMKARWHDVYRKLGLEANKTGWKIPVEKEVPG
ncbi:GNAT family N-acetyltransferase [Bacillus salacetis]|uniref:GNAT family N-acetyltransferase n=1 Tax=Bacillus salacetis TaxID=2315464 RepID=UPI003B9F8A63